MKKYIIILSFFQFLIQTNGQELSGTYLGGAIYYGIPLPHHSAIKYVLNSRTYGFDLNYTLKTSQVNYWDVLYRMPKIGFGYYFGNLGNHEIYGYNHAIYSFFESSIFKIKKYELDYALHVGLSYITKTFHETENINNIAIGSHINMFFEFSIQNSFQLSQNLLIFQNLSITHVSNGKVVVPNLGINQILFSTGLKILLKQNVNSEIASIPNIDNKIYIDLFMGGGIMGITNYVDGTYYAYTAYSSLLAQISEKRRIGLGLAYFYDNSLSEIDKIYLDDNPYTSDFNRIGFHLQHDVRYKNLSICTQFGYYIYNKHKNIEQSFYQQYGLKYHINKTVYGMVSLKAHAGTADNINWGFGVNL